MSDDWGGDDWPAAAIGTAGRRAARTATAMERPSQTRTKSRPCGLLSIKNGSLRMSLVYQRGPLHFLAVNLRLAGAPTIPDFCRLPHVRKVGYSRGNGASIQYLLCLVPRRLLLSQLCKESLHECTVVRRIGADRQVGRDQRGTVGQRRPLCRWPGGRNHRLERKQLDRRSAWPGQSPRRTQGRGLRATFPRSAFPLKKARTSRAK